MARIFMWLGGWRWDGGVFTPSHMELWPWSTAADTSTSGDATELVTMMKLFPRCERIYPSNPHEEKHRVEQRRALFSAGNPLRTVVGWLLWSGVDYLVEAERCELRLAGGLSGLSGSTGSFAWEVGKWEVFSAGQG